MTQRTLFFRTHCATQRQAAKSLRHALAAAGVCLLSVATSATGLAAARTNPAISQATYQALFNQLSAEPLRYGGLASAHNRRILIGLHQTGTGTVAGEMMRLDSAMRPLDAGPVTGTLTAPGSAQLSHCHLKVTLSDRDITLDGPCSATLLSGALTTRPRPSQLWSQVTNFISPDTSVSQYWLSRDTWQAAVTPAAAP